MLNRSNCASEDAEPFKVNVKTIFNQCREAAQRRHAIGQEVVPVRPAVNRAQAEDEGILFRRVLLVMVLGSRLRRMLQSVRKNALVMLLRVNLLVERAVRKKLEVAKGLDFKVMYWIMLL